MKTISTALRTAISNGTIATFVKITRTGSPAVILGYTDHDKIITIDGISYKPSPSLQRISMNLRNNAEVSNQEFLGAWTIDLDEDDLMNGLYDDASIDVFRADYTANYTGSPVPDTIIVFRGTLGMIQWTEDGFRADVHSLMRQLQRQIGATYTAKCRHQLFSQNSPVLLGACTLNAATYTDTSTVSSGSPEPTKIKFVIDTPTGSPIPSDGWYANGELTWTSGLNSGASYTIKSYISNVVTLFLPTVFTITAGDTFTIKAGCDKTFATCKNKFSNQLNFGGFPHIKPEVNFK